MVKDLVIAYSKEGKFIRILSSEIPTKDSEKFDRCLQCDDRAGPARCWLLWSKKAGNWGGGEQKVKMLEWKIARSNDKVFYD